MKINEKSPMPPVTQNQSLTEILNDIETRANAATPGPWEVTESLDSIETTACGDVKARFNRDNSVMEAEARATAAFIASARTYQPRLVKIAKMYAEELRFHGRGKKLAELAAILTSPENGEPDLGEPGAADTFSTR